MKRLTRLIIILIAVCPLLGSCAPFPELPDDILQPDTPEEGENADSQSDSSDGDENTSQSAANSQGSSETSAEAAADLVAPTGLVLNEIYYDAPGSDSDGVLFVELYAEVGGDLDFYQIRFINGDSGAVTEVIDLPESTTIADQDYYVIADGRTGALETTQVATYHLIDNFDPQNGPDGVQLLDREGQLVDTLVYGDGALTSSEDGLALGEGVAAPDPDSGSSVERLEPGLDTDDNAADFIINESPSPGTHETSF